ncbi:Crp/Fnr family transcriptional regulator [Nonomuraea sp. NPDC046570]|uniref:Crp/Fnr family transcriptional regulator n=1 Tax=Nonomuraea sp. NPDC046570 TaxID=3155255 RepID=UPI0033DB078E
MAGHYPVSTFLWYLPEDARARLLSLGTTVGYGPGHELISQDEQSHTVFLLLRAVVKVTGRSENGIETLLAVRVRGDVIGDMAAMADAPHSATVTTCGRTTAVVVKGPVFLDFVRRSPAAGLALNRLVGDRLRWANERRLDVAGYGAGVRLARVLLSLAHRHGVQTAEGLDIGVPLTQSELGGLIGAREATVQKALRELSRAGLVERGSRRVVITDARRLTAFTSYASDPD